MLQFFSGGDKGDKQKKVENDISGLIKNQLKKQFCNVCEKNLASKVAFGKDVKKPVFTCSSCELQAVGSPQRLGPKNLITFDKFIEIATNEIINYQVYTKALPAQYKKAEENSLKLKQKTKQITNKLTQQYKKLQKTVKQKQDEIISESLKSNTIFVFEELMKMLKQKKMAEIDNGHILLKKILCNNNGVHFVDHEALDQTNQNLNARFLSVIKQSKIKLKPIEDLIDEINQMKLD